MITNLSEKKPQNLLISVKDSCNCFFVRIYKKNIKIIIPKGQFVSQESFSFLSSDKELFEIKLDSDHVDDGQFSLESVAKKKNKNRIRKIVNLNNELEKEKIFPNLKAKQNKNTMNVHKQLIDICVILLLLLLFSTVLFSFGFFFVLFFWLIPECNERERRRERESEREW